MGSKALLLEGLKWCIRTGENIKVWEDAWISGNGVHFVPTPKDDSDMNFMVNHLIDEARGGWNMELVQHLFHEEEWERILSIPLSRFQQQNNRY